jgi:hypothetical protein
MSNVGNKRKKKATLITTTTTTTSSCSASKSSKQPATTSPAPQDSVVALDLCKSKHGTLAVSVRCLKQEPPLLINTSSRWLDVQNIINFIYFLLKFYLIALAFKLFLLLLKIILACRFICGALLKFPILKSGNQKFVICNHRQLFQKFSTVIFLSHNFFMDHIFLQNFDFCMI